MMIEKHLGPLLARLSNLPSDMNISSAEDAETAAAILREVVAIKKDATVARMELTRPLDQEKAAITDEFASKVVDPAAAIERTLKERVIAWQRKEEERVAAEARAAAELARKEQEKLAKRAEKAAEKGQDQKAATLERQAAAAAIPVYVPPPAKLGGLSKRADYKFRVVDETLVPREFLAVNMTLVGKVVRTMREKTSIPGVEVYTEDTVAVRR